MFSQAFTLLLAVSGAAADGLNARAVAAGKTYFGSATDNGELSDTAYSNLLKNTSDFGQITPGNSMKWDATEPSRNDFTFTNGDVIANLAATNGQKLRCHTLVWHSQLPSWVSDGNFDNATLIDIMKNHITTVMTHYKGKCLHWDVVNEALNDDGTYRSSVFYNTIGPAFIPIAFATAAAADPSAKLYYNDYSIETAGAKSTGAQNIVKSVKAYGAKIDGVGMQSHIIVGSSPSVSQWTTNMNAFTDLGVEVALTELDIRTSTPETSSALAQQATDYSNAVSGCKAVAKCVGITIWDFTDKYSWIPSVFPGQGDALPWDSNLNKKADVYNAILNAWGTASASGTTSAATTSTPATVAAPVTSSAGASAGGAGTVAKYAQCGGSGWTGATACASGATCKSVNEWYSQCQ